MLGCWNHVVADSSVKESTSARPKRRRCTPKHHENFVSESNVSSTRKSPRKSKILRTEETKKFEEDVNDINGSTKVRRHFSKIALTNVRKNHFIGFSK